MLGNIGISFFVSVFGLLISILGVPYYKYSIVGPKTLF